MAYYSIGIFKVCGYMPDSMLKMRRGSKERAPRSGQEPRTDTNGQNKMQCKEIAAKTAGIKRFEALTSTLDHKPSGTN